MKKKRSDANFITSADELSNSAFSVGGATNVPI
jgi:hypothetical protein